MRQQTGALRAKHANFNARAMEQTKELMVHKTDVSDELAGEEVRGHSKVFCYEKPVPIKPFPIHTMLRLHPKPDPTTEDTFHLD